jgi:hypothetical protein
MWFWGCGVRRDQWIPAATGANYPLSQELLPLQSVKEYVSVVSNTQDPFPGILGHHDGWVRMCTGSKDTFDGAYGNGSVRNGDGPFINPSLDQIVAAQWKGQTPYDFVPLIVSQRGAASDANYCVGISQKGQANGGVNYPMFNPHDVFAQLFGNFSPDPKAAQAALAQAQAKGNVLGGFVADAKTMQQKLGTTDRARIEQYLDNINDIAKRLQMVSPAASCAIPSAPPSMSNDLGNENLRGRGHLLADVLAAALACDITRVFAFEFSPMQANTIYHDLNFNDAYHTISHNNQGMVHQATVYNMGELAYLLEKLKATTEATGTNLLDNCCIYASSDVSQPDDHSTSNPAILVVGKAGGALKGGIHCDAKGASYTAVHLTMFRALGLPMTQFGYGQSLTTTTLGEL